MRDLDVILADAAAAHPLWFRTDIPELVAVVRERDARIAELETALHAFMIDLIDSADEKGRIPLDFVSEARDMLALLDPTTETP